MKSVNLSRLSRYSKKKQTKLAKSIKTVVGYCRVSTDSQEENTSLTVQREAIAAYCKAKNFHLLEIFSDVGSGSNFSRPDFSKMHELIFDSETKIDGVVLYKLDRLSRSVVDGYTFIDKLQQQNISTISINENIDNSTASGQAMLQLIFTFAEMERKVITERMVSGRKQKLKNGDKSAGQIFGYYYNHNKQLRISEKESETIRTIFSLYEQFRSLEKVKNFLRSKRIYSRKKNLFSRQALHYILTNIFYTGVMVSENKLIKGNHSRIIGDDQFERVQQILLQQRRN